MSLPHIRSANAWPVILILVLLLVTCSFPPATPAPTPALPIPSIAAPTASAQKPTVAPPPATLAPPTAAPTLRTATPVPQQITIDTPAPGTLVGSPVVITGRATRFPFEGNLSYWIIDASGAQIGAGGLQVSGSIGQPGSFAPSITFTLPPNGGDLRT